MIYFKCTLLPSTVLAANKTDINNEMRIEYVAYCFIILLSHKEQIWNGNRAKFHKLAHFFPTQQRSLAIHCLTP